MVTMKTSIKAKARTNVRAFAECDGPGISAPPGIGAGLFVLFGLLFRRRETFEAL